MKKTCAKPPCNKKALFISLVMLTVLPLTASGHETYRFERMWPTLPQPWYFNKPDGIAVGRDGLVYVFDTNYARVQKYTRDGLFITAWGKEGLGDGEFGICAGCNLKNGTALDDNGNVYVTDTINHRIQKFTRDGTFITKWGKNNGDGTSGTENGAFNYPSDIAVDGSGYVYVTDYYNHRVQKFSPNGDFVRKWGRNEGDGSYGTGKGEFVQPSSVTVDPGGFVLVADEINDRIQKFTSEGTFILMWDNAHPNGAQFNRPRDLTTDADGNIYVTNIGSTNSPSNKIHKINQNGQLLESWDNVPFASGVALDASGFMYVTDMGLNRIIILTPGGVIANIWGSYQDGENQLQFPDGIAVANGYVYVTEILSQRIKTFTLDGTDIASWGGTGTEDGKFHDTRGITADDSGNVFVCDRYNYRIQKFNAEGEFITKWGSGDNLPLRPEGIAVDMSGNVYVAESLNPPWPSRVQKFIPNPDGTEYAPDGTWNIWGNNEEFYNLYDIAVGSDETGTGYVYVTDWRDPSLSLPYYYYIHKFTLNGNYLTSWTEAVPGDAFNRPWGLATDDSGNVYVSDSDNYRVLKFNTEGQLLASFGSLGSAPGLIGRADFIALDNNGKVYAADTYNNRIQVFTKAESIENSRAIIVAGGGSYPGNNLWDATQMCANFAYRALTYQGFTKDDISYLSENADLDLDNDGVSNVATSPTNLNLNAAIQQAAIDTVENLVLYLTDHGGVDESGGGIFRLSETETLTASSLAAMLDIFPGRVIVIIDACQSGSFMDALEGATNRTIITSTKAGEQAQFINQGTISFSNFFWTGVFNGSNLRQSFDAASLAVSVLADQNPQLWHPLDINPEHVYIGNGVTGMTGDAPKIENIWSSPGALNLESSAVIRADMVTDPDGDGIARVWAVIWPPNYDPGAAANPLLTLPSVDLLPEAGGGYAAPYNDFSAVGIYQIAAYAIDSKGNTSQPAFTILSRSLTRRAIIVGGGSGVEPNRTIIEGNTSLAYNALLAQGYKNDEIYFMSVTGIPGFDAAPSVFYLKSYLESLANDGNIANLDLTIYLIGLGDTGIFIMNDDGDTLTASLLHAWLKDLQKKKEARITLIYDGNKSGSFIPEAVPIHPEDKKYLIITSTGAESAAYFKTEGNISFSSFFWDRAAVGATIGDAFLYASNAIAYCNRKNDISFSCYRPQQPCIDANCNSTANEQSDHLIAKQLKIGNGVAFADDPPRVESITVVREGDVITITAAINSTSPVEKVWAVIRPISYCPGASETENQAVAEAELFDLDGDETYQGFYPDADYACKVTVYAMSYDAHGKPNTSSPSFEYKINKAGGDIYEPDDKESQSNVIVVNYPTAQPHTFHHPDDVDWVKFYGTALETKHVYTIAVENLGVNCPVIELYSENDLTTPVVPPVNTPPVNDKIWLDFECIESGIYYVMLRPGACDWVEEKMSYDLRVYDDYAPLTALVAGKVRDSVSGEPVDGAVITSSGIGATISTRGDYIFSEVPGNWTITARKESYATSRASIRIEADEEYVRNNISMYPMSASGCVTPADCDDGIFCNGSETCVDKTCQPGTSPCPDDGIFCNGEETCSEETDACGHAGDPCQADLTCDEERDVCVGCMEDAQCDDGLFCNGAETCADGICQLGTYPCPEGVVCDEEANECLLPTLTIIPQLILQSHWIPLPVFMSIRGTNTHFSGASRVTFTPPSVMALPMLLNPETLLCLGLMMPTWVTGQAGEPLEVSVTTGSENSTGSVEIMLLPFLLGEESR